MILVTGASGSVGSRLVDRLTASGLKLRVGGRNPDDLTARWPALEVVELDVGRPETIERATEGIEAAYYLVHSMEPGSHGDFARRDAAGAANFARAASQSGIERVIYLGGLGGDGDGVSEHLESRHETGRILAELGPSLLEFRAAMVVSSDSASFRMLTDLVNRLPAMVLPRWVNTPSQPIALEDVLSYLEAGLATPLLERRTIVEIGGEVRTYREMIEETAHRRGRSPLIVSVPFLTPRLSSYWCGLTTDVPAALARPLIEGMSTPTLVRTDEAQRRFPDIHPVDFAQAMERAQADA